LSRFSAAGILQWSAPFGTSQSDVATAGLADNNGNVFVAWSAAGGTSINAHLSKFDAQGNVLWSKPFNVAPVTSTSAMTFDNSGNVLVTGNSWNAIGSSQTSNAFVATFSPDGDLLNTFEFGSARFDRAESIAVDRQGNILLSGLTEGALDGPNRGLQDAFVAKLTPAFGEPIWVRQFGSSSNEYGFGVATDANDNVIFTGAGVQVGNPTFGNWDAFVGVLDTDGNSKWIRQFGTANADWSEGLSVTQSGDIYLAGHTQGNLFGDTQGGIDVLVAGFNAQGTPIAELQFGGFGNDLARALAVSADASVIYVLGNTFGALGNESSAGSSDIFLATIVVPEPASGVLLAMGMALMFALRFWRARK
jgi:hypothetical protein